MNDKTTPYAETVIRLLQGVIYSDNERQWNNLLLYRSAVIEYFSKIGVAVVVAETDGFAYLQDMRDENDTGDSDAVEVTDSDNAGDGVSLFSKRPLGYGISMLAVILTKKIIDFDLTGGDQTRLIMSRDDIINSYSIFLPEKSNEARAVDRINADLNKLADYGFIRKIGDDAYEIKRILKAKFSGDILNEVNKKLEAYGTS